MILPPAAVADLGRIPDAEIARRYGLHPQAVRRARVTAGIPRCARWPAWLGAHSHRFGVEPDAAIAADVGITVQRVAFVRARWLAAER